MQFKITFHLFNHNIWYRYSKESSQWEGSFKHPKQILKLMSKKFSTILSPTFLAHRSRRLMGELIVYQWLWLCLSSILSILLSFNIFKHPLLWNHWTNLIQILYRDSLGYWSPINVLKLFFSETIRSIELKFHMKTPHSFRLTKFVNIFLPISFNICFRCSKEPYLWDGSRSFKYPQHMFWLRNKKIKFPLNTLN